MSLISKAKNLVIISSETEEENEVLANLAYNLRGYFGDNYNGSIIVKDHAEAGKEKMENKFRNPDYILMLWTKAASQDTDFLLSFLQAERVQLEQRIYRCINVRLEEGVNISHLKQKNQVLPWYQPSDLEGLANAISDIMNDKHSKVTERTGNVSEGLVWNYFVVYLKSLLPGIREAISDWRQSNEEKSMPNKIFLVIPASGKCVENFSDVMPKGVCETVGNLTVVEVDDAGIQGRKFTPNVHIMRNGADSEDWLYFAGEFCNPVNTIYQLEKEYGKVDEIERKRLIDHFSQRLNYILGHRDNALIHGSYHIINWNDSPGATPLNELLIREMQNGQ